MRTYDAVVIGGGFFGCRLALHLRRYMERVVIVEKDVDLLRRASFINQARVHRGYHYPRSFLTALRSRVNFPTFVQEYADCVDDQFTQYYAISRQFSNVSAAQYLTFCRRIGAEVHPAPGRICALFNPDLIEEVFQVTECAFDADKLRVRLWRDLHHAQVDCRLRTEVHCVSPSPSGAIQLRFTGDPDPVLTAYHVFNCTYSRLNLINRNSGLPIIPLKHELAEIAIVDVPEALTRVGITVMCGPFFSLMPFPARGLHSLSHVRYTPHTEWQDRENCDYYDPHALLAGLRPKSAFRAMVTDAQRYVPLLAHCRHRESLWEVKTVLPKSEEDDGRPILFRKDHGLRNYTCVLGSKIDNIYDCVQELTPAYA